MKQGSVCRAWKSCVGKGRRRLYQKALAVSLSVATAVSCLPANMASVSAATKPYVSMRTTFKTLQVGQKNRMTLKNNTAGWKIQKISTNDETIAAVSAKTEKSFQIQGKGVGRTTVKAVLKTTSRKKHTSKTVRCRVKVVAAEDTEPKPEPEQQTPVTETEVSTQEQLEQALTNVSLKKLTIAASNAAKFVIPAGSYPNVSLIVNAPLSDVENNGVFQSIEIHAVKPDTWFEKAVGNVIRVTAKAARMIVNKGAQVKEITFPQADADVKLEVNGKADYIRIQSKMKLSVSGKPETDLSVSVEQTAADTQIVSETPLGLSLHAAASLTFEKGAEGSVVSLAAAGIKATISNLTSKIISVKRPNGTPANVNAGQKNMQVSSDTAQNSGSASYGSSSGSGSGSGTGSGSGSGTGSGSGSGTGSGSGMGSGSEDTNKNDIPTPSLEDVQKGIKAECTVITVGADGDDSKVYWKLYLKINKDVTFFEDRPELTMQYSVGVGDDKHWYTDGISSRSSDDKKNVYKLAGSARKTSGLRVYFRFADKEKGTAGEEIEVPIQEWNEEVIGRYLRDYLSIREAQYEGKPFSIKIMADSIQDNKIVMVYDKEKQPYASELEELPQWTGDGPKIPKIQAAEALEKSIGVDEIKTTVIISGASLEALEKKEGKYYLKVEIPITPLQIPAELPNGKFKWNNSFKRGDFVVLKEKETFQYIFAKNSDFYKSVGANFGEKSIDMEFCFETAGGEVYTPEPIYDGDETGETDKGIMESQVTLQVYDEALEQRCMDKLKEELAKADPKPQNVSWQFTITKFGVEGNIIKAVDTTVIDAKPVQNIPEEEWEN